MSKITTLIENQFPGWIQNDGENFVLFLKTYYEWMECAQLTLNYSDLPSLYAPNIVYTEHGDSLKIKANDTTNNILFCDCADINNLHIDDTLYPEYSILNHTRTSQFVQRGFPGEKDGKYGVLLRGGLSKAIGYVEKDDYDNQIVYIRKPKLVDVTFNNDTLYGDAVIIGLTSGAIGVMNNHRTTDTQSTIIVIEGTFKLGESIEQYNNPSNSSTITNISDVYYSDLNFQPGEPFYRFDNKLGMTAEYHPKFHDFYMTGSYVNTITPIKIVDIQYNPTKGSNSFVNIRDVDNTIDIFMEQFRKELAESIPKSALVDKKLLYKHIKDFYLAKGSENAFKFLFNILYELPIKITYPKDQVFKPSDNTWVRYKILRVYDTEKTDFKNRTIKGNTSEANATVEFEVSYRIGTLIVKDLYVDVDTIDGEFVVNEIITTTDNLTQYTAKIVGAITDIDIVNGGSNYSVGDEIVISGDGSFATGSVSSISKGYIDRVVIEYGGADYEVGDSFVLNNTGCSSDEFFKTAVIEVSSVDGSGAILAVNIKDHGYGYIKTPTFTISSTAGSGANLTLVPKNIGSIQKIEITNSGVGYKKDELTSASVTTSTGDGAVITPVIGCLIPNISYFRNNNSFTSNDIFIFDGNYYQEYSYIIHVGLAMRRWRNIIKKLAHPAGMNMFAVFHVESLLSNELKKKYAYYTIGELTFLYIFFNDNDCNEEKISFIDEDLNLYYTSHIDLNTLPYYKYRNVLIFNVDLNNEILVDNTVSSGPISIARVS